MAVLVGIIFIALGLAGFFCWFQEFLFVLKGLLPVVLLTSGVLALFVGIASITSRRSNGKPKP
jgi:multisubunit Na+/H+ antiporter MnhG subunit